MLQRNTTLNRQQRSFDNVQNDFDQFVDIEEYNFNPTILTDHKINNQIADSCEFYEPIMEDKIKNSIDFSYVENNKQEYIEPEKECSSIFKTAMSQIQGMVKGAINIFNNLIIKNILYSNNNTNLLGNTENKIKTKTSINNNEIDTKEPKQINISPSHLQMLEEGMLNSRKKPHYQSWAERTTSSVSSRSRG